MTPRDGKLYAHGNWPVYYDGEIAREPSAGPCEDLPTHAYVVTDVAGMFEPPVIEHRCRGCGHTYYTRPPDVPLGTYAK